MWNDFEVSEGVDQEPTQWSMRLIHVRFRVRPQYLLRWLIASVPDFVLAATFLLVWLAPEHHGGREMFTGLLLVVLAECVLASAPFFFHFLTFGRTFKGYRIVLLIALGIFFIMSAKASADLLHRWWPLLVIAGQVGNHLLDIWKDRSPTRLEKDTRLFPIIMGVGLYVLLLLTTLLLPLPPLGITPEAIPEILYAQNGSPWTEMPWRVLALGFSYFLLLPFCTFFSPFYRFVLTQEPARD